MEGVRTGYGSAFVKGLGCGLTQPSKKLFLARRGGVKGWSRSVARASLNPEQMGDTLSQAIGAAHEALYTLADAANDVAVSAAVAAASATDPSTTAVVNAVKEKGWFDVVPDTLEVILKWLEQGLVAFHVPYAYGFAIILLTVLVKAVTLPLTKQQVESTMAMQNLAPKIKAIQAKYAGDQERIQLETARVYKQAGVNPLAGCLPTLATLPVWIGLYNALSNVAKEGVFTEGFFWIPSLAGPTTLDSRAAGGGLSWLFPFVDGTPPLGWSQTAAYLVLPVLLVISQFVSMQLLSPPQSDDPAQKNTQVILKFLPLMIGWFSLSVPSGLSLYWFTNNLLTTGQTVYLRKMGGANVIVAPGAPEIIDVGVAKRSATPQVATKEDKERAKGERFRALKEAEQQKKAAARKAAEDAAREAALKAEEERSRLLEQRQVALAKAEIAEASAEAKGEESEDDVEDVEEDTKGNGAAAGAAVASNGAPTTARRSRRSRRTKKA